MVFRESVEPGDIGPAPENRRDFLYIATGAVAVVGAAAVVWPFIDSMQPSADISAIASVEVDLSTVEPGQRLTVKWRGQTGVHHSSHASHDRAGTRRRPQS